MNNSTNNQKKDKIEKKALDFAIKDYCNCCAIIHLDENKQIVNMQKEGFKVILASRKCLVLEEPLGDRIVIYHDNLLWGVYNKDFFTKAREIIKLWYDRDDYEGILIADKKDCPICVYTGSLGILIAPRVCYGNWDFPNAGDKPLNPEVLN